MMDADILNDISKKLSVLITIGLKDKKGQEETSLIDKIRLLTSFGLSNDEIANITGATKGTVGVLKSRINKKRKR